VGFTRPYFTERRKHVLAVPPGENAWLMLVDRTLRAQEAAVGPLITEFTR